MATNVLLPQWGMNMQEGTLAKWLKREGDSVGQGEALVEVETAKISSELEAPTSGVIAYILIPEGETVPVGTTVAIIAIPGEEVARPAPPTPHVAPGSATITTPASSPTATSPAAQVIPGARRLAQKHRIDLAQVRGSGPGGRITEADVTQAIEGQAQPAAAVTGLTGTRKVIAERMLQSVRTMAQVTLTTEVDMTEAVELRKELVGQWRAHRIRPMDQDLVAMATARDLRGHPALNATLDSSGIRLLEEINIGIALTVPDGLAVGVVHDANQKTLLAIAQEVRELASKARDGKLSPGDVTGGTFTITALGNFDIDGFTPIINPPEVAILGIGRVVEKPAVHQGEITKRSMMFLSLTFDHRALDGAPAAQFLQSLKRHLEQPRWMLS